MLFGLEFPKKQSQKYPPAPKVPGGVIVTVLGRVRYIALARGHLGLGSILYILHHKLRLGKEWGM